mmetsp:Transcript_497/g.889  ORF Transcript_497/g.889 Transcript_497/m.889 type:complete len:207 (-) Transcript_497:60-680(-)
MFEKINHFVDEDSIESNDTLRIQNHLFKVLRLLKADNVGDHIIFDALHRYASSGNFPQPSISSSSRLPCFIDDHGTHCAVASLLRSTGHGDLASRLASSFNYSLVMDMPDDPELLFWASSHSLSKKHLAMIQPTYPPSMNFPFIPSDPSHPDPSQNSMQINPALLASIRESNESSKKNSSSSSSNDNNVDKDSDKEIKKKKKTTDS